MANPTPGPWGCAPSGARMQGYDQGFAIHQSGTANLVAGVFTDVNGGAEVCEANARLIAASPDLIEYALLEEEYSRACDRTRPDWTNMDVAKFMLAHDIRADVAPGAWLAERRRAAIAKAEARP